MARMLDPSEINPYLFHTFADQDPCPWGDWMNGEVWELEQGVDFGGDMAKFRARAYRKGVGFDLKLRSRINGTKILIQYTP